MKKTLFGQEHILEKIVKDGQDWLRWEMPAADFSNFFKNIEKEIIKRVKEIELKTGVKPDIQNELDKLQGNYKTARDLRIKRNLYLDDMKKFLDNLSCEKLGFLNGNKGIEDNDVWVNKSTIINNTLHDLLDPLTKITKHLDSMQVQNKTLVSAIEEKLDTKFEGIIFCPTIKYCDPDMFELSEKIWEMKNFIQKTGYDIYHANKNSLNEVKSKILKFRQEYNTLQQKYSEATNEMNLEKARTVAEAQQKVFNISNEIQNERKKQNIDDANYTVYELKIIQLESELRQVERQKQSDILMITTQKESEIRQLQREITNLKESHDKEIINLKEVHAKEFKALETIYSKRELNIEDMKKKLNKQGEEIKELKANDVIKTGKLNEQDKKLNEQDKKLEKQDKKLFWQDINNKVLGASTILLAGLVLNAAVGDPVGEYFTKKKIAKPPTIEIKHEPIKYQDTLEIDSLLGN